LREDHSQVRSAGKPQALAALNTIVLALMDWLRVGNMPDQMRCAGYFVYPFQNQEGNSHAGNFNETYLERRLKRKTLVELS